MTKMTIETSKMTGKKIGNIEYVLQESIQYDSNGEQVDFYDGSSIWYSIQKFIDGVPAGKKSFGSNYKKAYNYLKKIN